MGLRWRFVMMKILSRCIVILLMFHCRSLNLIAAPVSLAEAVEVVVLRNAGLQAQRSQQEAAKAMAKQYSARRLPQVRLNAQALRGDDPVYVFGSLLRQDQFGPENFAISSLNRPDPLTNFSHGVELGVPLFTAFQLDTAIKTARASEQQAHLRFDSTAQKIRRQVVLIVLQVLRSQDQAAVLDRRIQSSQEELKSAERLNKRGLVLGSDYEAARALASSLELRAMQAKTAAVTSIETLAHMMGVEVSDLSLKGNLTDDGYSLDDLDRLTHSARSKRSDIKEAEIGVAIAEASKKQTQYSLFPSIEAFGHLEAHSEDFLHGSPVHMLGARAQFPLGDPTYPARRTTAQAQSRASVYWVEALEETMEVELTQARSRIQSAKECLPLAKQTKNRAEQSLTLFRPLYREGRQSILDVLRAEADLAQAELAVIELRYHLHDGYAELAFVSGAMDDTRIKEIDGRLQEVRP